MGCGTLGIGSVQIRYFSHERSESGGLQRLERGIHICQGAFIVHVPRGAAYSMCYQVRIPKSRRNSVLIVPTYLILLQSVSNSKGVSLFVSFSFLCSSPQVAWNQCTLPFLANWAVTPALVHHIRNLIYPHLPLSLVPYHPTRKT